MPTHGALSSYSKESGVDGTTLSHLSVGDVSSLLGHGFLHLLLLVEVILLGLLSVLGIDSLAFKYLFSEELVLPLGSVSTSTGHKHASTHGASRDEDGNGVDGELSRVLDTELKDTPPVEGVENPETT